MELVLNIIIASLLAINLFFFAIFFRFLRGLINEVYDFVTPKAENEPAPIQTVIESISHNAGQAVAMEIKTTLMGKMSGDSRLQKGIESDIAADVAAGKYPLIDAALQAFPSLRKRALKNPLVLELILSKLPGLSQGGVQSVPPGSDGTDYGTRLNKYS